MIKQKLTVLLLLTFALIGTSHAEPWVIFTCTHAPGSVNEHYDSWVTTFPSNDQESLDNATRLCFRNGGESDLPGIFAL